MKYVLLAAGKSNSQLDIETPVCLSPFNEDKLILDVLLNNIYENGGDDIYIVGGFGILKILEQYPKLKFFYSKRWQTTKSLDSFYASKTIYNEDIILSFTDVVYKQSTIEKISDITSDLGITIDSKWKRRFEGRSNEFLFEAEKVFKSKTGNRIRIAKGFAKEDEIVLGESVGVFYLSRLLATILEDTIESNFDLNTASVADLITFFANKYSCELVDIEGEWAEMDSPADLIQFRFGTKADTLRSLENNLNYSKILPQIKCTINEIESDIDDLIYNVQSYFRASKLVVRSSAINEDTHESSMAGNYESILDVSRHSKGEIMNAISKVVSSYLKGNQIQDANNQVLIQPQLEHVKMSGVLFTKDLETSAPYYIINYDISGKTDTITSGLTTNSERTFIFSKNSLKLPENRDLKKIIKAAREIESVTGHDSLDIEFAISNDEVFILQVRPIAAHKNALKVYNNDVKAELENIKHFFIQHQINSPKLAGNKTIYGVMPDWNPAEIIGINPYPLAFDLYKEIITDEIWPKSREVMGYRKINHHPGIFSFSGKPYVDIRMSFNSFTPKTISERTANKLINFYIDKLISKQHLHDKVEFDICITSYDFTFDSKMEELKNSGFNIKEIEEVKSAFHKLTSDIVNESVIKIEEEIDKTLSLTKKRTTILNSKIPVQDKVVKLIEDCKEYGTHSFSIMARFGFFSSILLKSLMKTGVISEKEYDDFFKSINTVAKDFLKDLSLLSNQKINKEEFLHSYGHLRPGTYDINSKIYSENFENYLELGKPIPYDENESIVFNKITIGKINNELRKHNFNFNAEVLLDFAKRATEAREKTKFEFSKNLSKALELIVEFGQNHGISRENAAFLNYSSIIKAAGGSISSKIGDELFNEIECNKKKHQITSSIKLPALITSSDDVDFFFQQQSVPNFITQIVLDSEVIFLDNNPQLDIENKLILIENADPGFDWIFSHNIKGLATKFGGAASHMAIRCAEFGLPAAIGCGDKIFDKLLMAKRVRLDCLNKKVTVLQ